MAVRTERNGVVFLSSIPSRKIQKKQKRPRSNSKPKLMPISKEIGAVELLVFDESTYARRSKAATTTKEIAVRIFSLRVHVKAATSESVRLLLFA